MNGTREGTLAISRARTLRRDQTAAETRLWQRLRNRALNGHKFVRQMPIGPYFGDFVCRREALIVEVDGATHGLAHEIWHDNRRSALLAKLGYRVLRFHNAEVFDNLDGVVETILAYIERRCTI